MKPKRDYSNPDPAIPNESEPISHDSNRLVRLPQLLKLLKPEDRPPEYEEHFGKVEKVPNPFVQCFTDNLSCLVTVLLAFLQALLLATFPLYRLFLREKAQNPSQNSGQAKSEEGSGSCPVCPNCERKNFRQE